MALVLWAVGAGCDASGTVNNGGGTAPTTTLRVSLDASDLEIDRGGLAGLISGDGRRVAFLSDSISLDPALSPRRYGVFVKDLETRSLTIANRAAGAAGAVVPSDAVPIGLSRDGRRVAFLTSGALDPADTNLRYDIYVRDLETFETILATRGDGAAGVIGNGRALSGAFSADGLRLAFTSDSTNLDPADTDGLVYDLYVRDLAAGTTRLISRASGAAGAKATQESYLAAISGDGSLVLFANFSSNLVSPAPPPTSIQMYLRNVTAQTTEAVSRAPGLPGAYADGTTTTGDISLDGRFVTFSSDSKNLHPDDADAKRDIFVRDLLTGEVDLVSRATGFDGTKGLGDSFYPRISGDGRYVAFQSFAANLVEGDTNGTRDVFLRDRLMGVTQRVTVRTFGSQVLTETAQFSMSEDGAKVAFTSAATDIVDDDSNGFFDVFIRSPLR
ncbi:MAG TPA: hypothetical protein VF950_13505 [Planctomycetota bacterium]